ncbi:hypothetical protein APY03_0031 [Variovorax sp. WDL1]|nr:hypothetical protein APY03_0031 [Variovorax sp. WDL1]
MTRCAHPRTRYPRPDFMRRQRPCAPRGMASSYPDGAFKPQ